MKMNEKLTKLEELLKTDESLAKELFTIPDPEAAQKWMASHGIDMTLDEVKAFGAHLASLKSEDEELSDDELKKAAGGARLEDFDDKEEAIIEAIKEGFIIIWDYITSW